MSKRRRGEVDGRRLPNRPDQSRDRRDVPDLAQLVEDEGVRLELLPAVLVDAALQDESASREKVALHAAVRIVRTLLSTMNPMLIDGGSIGKPIGLARKLQIVRLAARGQHLKDFRQEQPRGRRPGGSAPDHVIAPVSLHLLHAERRGVPLQTVLHAVEALGAPRRVGRPRYLDLHLLPVVKALYEACLQEAQAAARDAGHRRGDELPSEVAIERTAQIVGTSSSRLKAFLATRPFAP